MAGVHAAGLHQRLDEPSDVVVDERRDDGGAQTEATSQGAGDVVLTAAFPDVERAGGADACVARIESQHHLAEGDAIPARLVGALDRQAQPSLRSPATQAVVGRSTSPFRRHGAGWRLVARI